MKNSYLAGIVLTVSFGLNAQGKGPITGQNINYDASTGSTSITKVVISPDNQLKIQAGHGQFTVDENELPLAIHLTESVIFQMDDIGGTADTAVYYPELQLLSTSRLSVASNSGYQPLARPFAMVSYTCASGTLYGQWSFDGRRLGLSRQCADRL